MNALIFIYFSFWVITQYYFFCIAAQVVMALANGSSLCWLPCAFDIRSSKRAVCVCVCVCVLSTP